MNEETAKRNKLLFAMASGLLITSLSAISYTNNNPGDIIETKKNFKNSKIDNHQNFSSSVSKNIPQNPSFTSPNNATHIQTLDVSTILM